MMPKAEATCFSPCALNLLAEYLLPPSSMMRSWEGGKEGGRERERGREGEEGREGEG